ncbi:hypothetical protein R4B61_02825 [Fructilactobacillus vespulae]|uniref:hypothetical protein n=1 Tax=Fructilactobacillus vespulae TaxID=1249630 RepID=UPI0039B58013
MNTQTLFGKMNIIYYITLVAAIIETVLAIPVLGGIIVMTSVYSPLGILMVLYIAGLVFAITTQSLKGADQYNIEISGFKTKFIIGIVAAAIAVIPVVGWILHIVMAVIMWSQYLTISSLKEKVSKDNIIEDIKQEDIHSDDQN